MHDLRHTHATLTLQAGVHPKVISGRLGHATVAMTLRLYSHAIPALQHHAAAAIADLTSGAAAALAGWARTRRVGGDGDRGRRWSQPRVGWPPA